MKKFQKKILGYREEKNGMEASNKGFDFLFVGPGDV